MNLHYILDQLKDAEQQGAKINDGNLTGRLTGATTNQIFLTGDSQIRLEEDLAKWSKMIREAKEDVRDAIRAAAFNQLLAIIALREQ